MKLNKYKLGELIKQVNEKNIDNKYKLEDVKGISIKKEFIETKADMSGVSLKPYLIVKPDYFAYVTVTSRNGEKITIAHNDTENTYIVSTSYIVFEVSRKDLLDTNYLFMYFNRFEFDRYSRFNSWGSARETFSWEEMCDIDIELPDIKIQQKYVDIYKAMLKNQKSYEKGLDDLKLVCDGYIDKIKNNDKNSVGELVLLCNEKNIENKNLPIYGINIQKEFMPTIANVSEDNKTNYKLMKKDRFVFSGMQTGRDGCIRIGLYKNDFESLVSPAYTTFEVNSKAIPEYFIMLFKRNEMDRYGAFLSDASIRSNLDWDVFLEIKVPIPITDIQKDIVDIYNTYMLRKEINEKLKNKLKELCPILIKGSIEEAKLS